MDCAGSDRIGADCIKSGGSDHAESEIADRGGGARGCGRPGIFGARRCGRQALALQLDCTAPDQVGEAFAKVRERFGDIDILFNNVGQSAREKASEFWCSEEETWRFVLEVSLLTAMR